MSSGKEHKQAKTFSFVLRAGTPTLFGERLKLEEHFEHSCPNAFLIISDDSKQTYPLALRETMPLFKCSSQ